MRYHRGSRRKQRRPCPVPMLQFMKGEVGVPPKVADHPLTWSCGLAGRLFGIKPAKEMREPEETRIAGPATLKVWANSLTGPPGEIAKLLREREAGET